jgi:aspartate kinase
LRTFTDIEGISEELDHFASVNIHFDKSQISVVGEELRETKGIMKKIFSCMNNFSVDMISAGGSDINVSFVVSRDDLSSVMQTLHDELF